MPLTDKQLVQFYEKQCANLVAKLADLRVRLSQEEERIVELEEENKDMQNRLTASKGCG